MYVTDANLWRLARELVFLLVTLLRRSLPEPKEAPPLDGPLRQPLSAAVGTELVAECGNPVASALVVVLERKKPTLEEELVGGHHRVAPDGELEVGVGRRARGARRRRLHVEVTRERHARAHRRVVEAGMIRVEHVNACHEQNKT